MSNLHEFTKGELAKLVTQDWVGKVTSGIQVAIAMSFETDQVLRPVQTENEIAHRFEICIRWFVILRRDLGWTVPKIIDKLPTILRTELDGGKFEPEDERSSWLGR